MENNPDADLQQLKLKLEIQRLQTPWWADRETLRIALPSLIAVASLLLAASSGLIDVRRERLELEKARVQQDIERFEAQRTAIIRDNSRLSARNAELRDSIFFATDESRRLRDSLQTHIQEIDRERQLRLRAQHDLSRSQADIQELAQATEAQLIEKEEELKRLYRAEIDRINQFAAVPNAKADSERPPSVGVTVQVHGRVASARDSLPIAGARVEVSDRFSDYTFCSLVTNESGLFECRLPPARNRGRISVSVSHPRYPELFEGSYSSDLDRVGSYSLDIPLGSR